MSSKQIALVTGANKGIGYEVVQKLLSQGFYVLLGARDKQRGLDAVAKLQTNPAYSDVEFVQLETTDQATIDSTREHIEKKFGRLDILINNAGIFIDNYKEKPSATKLDVVRKTFDTNFFGVIAVTQALLPLVQKAPAGRIVNVSSVMGSLTDHSDPTSFVYPMKLIGYNSSKSALNAFTISLAHELKDTPIKVNSACPGYCATDINDNKGIRTAEQGSVVIVKLATLGADGPTGGYFNDAGTIRW